MEHHVDVADAEGDSLPFPERFTALRYKLNEQFVEGSKLEEQIKLRLMEIEV